MRRVRRHRRRSCAKVGYWGCLCKLRSCVAGVSVRHEVVGGRFRSTCCCHALIAWPRLPAYSSPETCAEVGEHAAAKLLLVGVVFGGATWIGLPLVCQGAEGPEASQATIGPSWTVDEPHGPTFEQPIDAQEGTWISLDVSPDGKQIVFDFLGDLYRMPIGGADGSEGRFPTKLTSGVSWDMQPRFSPDGQWIAFTSDRTGKSQRGGDNLWIMGLDGQNLKQVTSETYRLVNGPAWSADGNYLVGRKHFTGRRSLGSGEMWLYHRAGLDTSTMSGLQLTERPNEQKDVNEPVFSRDGKYLLFSQDVTSGDTFEYDKDSNKQIYVIQRLELATGQLETYISGTGGACRPVPAPDGRQIAFVRRVDGRTGLHLFDVRSGAVRLLYDRLERDMQEAWAIHGVYPNFAWTPEGESIVIWAAGQIRRIRVADGAETVIPFRIQDSRTLTRCLRLPIEVAPDEFDVKMLRWVQTSPSGNQVVFQALGYIYVRDLPDGQPRRLTSQTEHFEFYPSYSRDGRYLVYTTWHDEKLGSIRVASVLPGAPQEAWTVSEEPGHYLEPVFSPDGQTIVYTKSGDGYLRSHLWSRDPGIYRVPVRGGQPERIVRDGSTPQFAADSERVFFLRRSPGPDSDNLGLYSFDLQKRETQQHFTSQWATDYCFAPDGRWIAFVERFNVYLAPFVQTGRVIEVGPKTEALPLAKVSHEAGDWIHFSGDSQRLYWVLGPTLYTRDLKDVFAFVAGATAPLPEQKPVKVEIGFRARHEKPVTRIALVGGRLVTMDEAGTIEDGTILIEGNRIIAVGPRDAIAVPADARVVDVRGQVVLPGLVDVHEHGPLATDGITPQRSWVNYARLAFGVTTIHDPSNDTRSIFAASEMTKAGVITGPRTFSTGTILYGATGSAKAEIESLDDARFHLQRMKAVGAFTVKSYNQPRRDQRQQVVAAARELQMMVVPEGGSTFMHNMTMIVDGHTGIEHTLPVQKAYDDVMDLWRGTGVGYTPTLCVAYGGLSGEQYWYERDDLWKHERLNRFVPAHILHPRTRRRQKSPEEDYNHIQVAGIARQVVADGGLVQAGGHGQLNGLCTHWELWSFVQGGMTPLEALRCGTLRGAQYLGLDQDLGSLRVGKLADVIVIEAGCDPTSNIRDSERIQYVVANGHLFDARTMDEFGAPQPRPPFFWQTAPFGMSTPLPRVPGCECCRPGGMTRGLDNRSSG